MNKMQSITPISDILEEQLKKLLKFHNRMHNKDSMSMKKDRKEWYKEKNNNIKKMEKKLLSKKHKQLNKKCKSYRNKCKQHNNRFRQLKKPRDKHNKVNLKQFKKNKKIKLRLHKFVKYKLFLVTVCSAT